MNNTESRRIVVAPFGVDTIIAFGSVGAVAALVHTVVVSLTVPLGIHPLVANVLGFSAAFGISFAGHQRWTFGTSAGNRRRALKRFFAVALAGFVLNESLYALLLSITPLDYRVALVLVLIVVAGSTFIASRHWAFADER